MREEELPRCPRMSYLKGKVREGKNGPNSDKSSGDNLCCIRTTSNTVHISSLSILLCSPPYPSPHTCLCLANRDNLMEGVTSLCQSGWIDSSNFPTKKDLFRKRRENIVYKRYELNCEIF